MPLIAIHLLEGRSAEQKKNLLSAVTEAVHRSLDAPLPTIRIWIQEFSPDDYMIGGRLASERDRK